MASRAQNEQKFKQWEELAGGGRVIFGITSVGPAGVLVTSKKWMRLKERLVLLRKFTIRLAVLWLCTRNFQSI